MKEIELYNIYLKISKILDCEFLRIFSNLGKELIETDIKNNLKRMCEQAKNNNIKLIMENERGTYAKSPEQCLKLINEEKNVNILYDLENAFFEGYDIYDVYEKAKERITYIHLRDFDIKNNCYAHLGKGCFDLEKFLTRLKEDSYNGVISVETHLPMNNSGKGKYELFEESMKNFYNIVEKIKIKVE